MPDQTAQKPLAGPGKIALGVYLFLVTSFLAYATIAVWPSREPGGGQAGAGQGGAGQAAAGQGGTSQAGAGQAGTSQAGAGAAAGQGGTSQAGAGQGGTSQAGAGAAAGQGGTSQAGAGQGGTSQAGAGAGAGQGGAGQAGAGHGRAAQTGTRRGGAGQAGADLANQGGRSKEAPETIQIFWKEISVSPETQLILLVLVVGALGGCIHAANSFAAFAGNENLHASWVWYYVLRAPISATLALIAYFAVRGGFFTAGGSSISDVNVFGIAALAGLVGMFSKQATAKLEEVFSTLFRTSSQPPLGGQLTNKAPILSGANPATIPHANGDTTLTLTGDGFVEKSEVRWAGSPLSTKFVKASQLTAVVPAEKLVAVGSFDITVFNPAPGGGTSDAIKVTVT